MTTTDANGPAAGGGRHKVLGLSCGGRGGSAEIVLVAALRAAQAAGAEVELVRLGDLSIPAQDGPAQDGSTEMDDLWWYWDRLVECDGLIISSPIMSRTVSARLKLLVDRLLGPNADAAIIEHLVALRAAGQEPVVPFRVDQRVLKPRVAGFLAVGGALTSQWRTLALPLMHTATFSMHIAVVDQVLIGGAGTARSVVLDDAAMERAARLGANVAGQLGRPFDQAQYLGEPGLCPMCHLDLVSLAGPRVECATCGARGELRPDLSVSWTDLDASVISMAEKRAHGAEIQETAARLKAQQAEIDARASGYDGFEHIVRPTRAAAIR
jgi:multimeric flavodoxin WrbA